MQENLHAPNAIRTFTGQYLNLPVPEAKTIFLSDIAVGLSRECRFGGHTKHFYSVAEHSLLCADYAAEIYPDDKDLPLKALLHDAHEAYLKDIPSPLKKLLPGYELLAQKVQSVIHQRFGVRISHVDEERIKEIDIHTLQYEWFRKKLHWEGPVLTEDQRVNLFTKEVVRLCNHLPLPIQP